MVDIPVIETERLILRAVKERDLDQIAAFYGSYRSHFVGGPLTRHQCWRLIIGTVGHWHFRGYGMWIAEHKTDAIACGMIGFLNHVGWDEPELAWHIYGGYEGQGLAYEACNAAKSYGAAQFGIAAPISYCHPYNARSIKLAERLGARFEREGNLNGTPCHVYRHAEVAA